MTKSSSASRASTFPRAPLLPNAATAGTPSSMPTPALLSLACDPSGATIASSSSTGHRGRRSGRQQDPSAAPSCRWTRRSASLQRRVSSGRAHVFDRKKMRKVELNAYPSGRWVMKVKDYLAAIKRLIITCRPEDTIETAATLLATNHIGAMPVRDANGRIVGMFSERDIIRAFSQRGKEVQRLLVGD